MSLKTRENEPNTGGAKKKVQDWYSSFLTGTRILSIPILTGFVPFLKFVRILFFFLGGGREPSVYLVFQSGQNKHIQENLSFEGYEQGKGKEKKHEAESSAKQSFAT